MSELFAGVALKLLAAGLQRGVSVLLPKVLRIRKIDGALKGVAENENVRVALDDFRKVAGHLYGEYTERLSAFLLEIEKGGIVDAMVETAILGRDSDATKTLFRSAHSAFFSQDVGDADAIYDRLIISFSVTVRALSNDRIIFDLIQGFHKQIATRLDQLDDAISGLSVPKDFNIDDANPILRQLAKGLAQSFRTIRVETKEGARNVDITKIYIPPKLNFRPTSRNSRRLAAVTKSLGPAAERIIRGEGPHPGERISQSLPRFAFSEVRSGFRRIVVLGDPGGGKSTLCQRLCYDLAKNASFALQHGERKEIPAHEQRFPIRVILRAFEQARTTEPQLDVMTYICRDLANYVSTDSVQIRDVVHYLFNTGRAFFAFDGLDEILETSRRREFVDLVVSFSNKYPLCPVIVTSRLVGFDFAPLPGDFEELILSKFDNDEVKDYALKFLQEVGELEDGAATREADRFVAQTSNNASDLRQNPLMLGLMAWLFLSHGNVPSNRPEIYKECAILMFERWDRDRGIRADVPRGFDRLQLFSRLAAKIFPDPKLRAGVTREWLHSSLVEYFLRSYESEAKAQEAAISLADFLVGRAWVMTEIGDGVFGFTHQTFLEYFYARHLDNETDSTSQILKLLRPRIVKKEWDVVAHLALQIKTYRNDRRQEEAIAIIVKDVSSNKSKRAVSSQVSFLAKALEYLSPSEASVREVLEIIFTHDLVEINSAPTNGLKDIAVAISGSDERSDFVDEQVVRLVIDEFKATEWTRRVRIARQINGASLVPEDWQMPAQAPAIPLRVRRQVIELLREQILTNAFRDRLCAALAWCWYAKIDERAFDEFGIDVVLYASLPGELLHLDGFAGMLFASSAIYSQYMQIVQISDARKALGELSEYILRDGGVEWLRDVHSITLVDIPFVIWAQIFEEYESLKDNGAEIVVLMALLLRCCFRGGARGPRGSGDHQAARRLLKLVRNVHDERLKLKYPNYEALKRSAIDALSEMLPAPKAVAEMRPALRG